MLRLSLLLWAILACTSLPAQTEKSTDNSANAYYAPVKYRNIGPFRGGRSVCASGVAGDPVTYYMGTTGGGLWKTSDAGQHWDNISDGYFKTGSVGAVAVSTSHPNIVYVGMGEHAPRGVMTSYGDGMYKSTDAGKTWQHIGLKETQHIARVIIHPTNPDIVWVAAQGALHGNNKERGIFKTTDGGKTWQHTLYINDMTGCSELSLDLSNPQVLYAAMWHHQRKPWTVISGGEGSGLYKSTDAGDTWTRLEGGGLPKEMGKMAIAVSQANPDKVFALIESDWEKDLGGLYVSNDAGKNWSKVTGDHNLIQRSWYYIEVFPDPNDEHTVYVLNAGAWKSIDGGHNWSRITGTHGDYHDLWINPDNSKNLCIANDGGAAISFNQGKSWSTQDIMPTSQFYRINVDNDWPYNIYGGQQDNSSIKIASRAIGSGSITERHWEPSAGGESAFIALDPDHPRMVLGGSYLSNMQMYDSEAKASTGVEPEPIQYLGETARDMKYLFNWNAPALYAINDPGTWYQCSQFVHRSRDMGITWEVVSPDLTRDQDDKQGNGGMPYTNEAVGAENYGTISYIAESPHQKGVIWTGSDDGFVHVTRDNAANWTNVTPNGLDECLINAIDVSPHDPATAYIATTRYKFNDKTPAIYKTTNYGKTWKNISAGIPYGAFTRVIREDQKRKDLLYLGTETGIYISWDGGAKWEPLQLNMPVTPILDMIQRHDDLAIATSGRSFWILDDIGLLRQHDAGDGLHLYQPEDTYIVSGRSQMDGNSATGTSSFSGVNPATGVVFYYDIPKSADSIDVQLEIKDASGKVINAYTNQSDKDYKSYPGGPGRVATISKKEGLNRFVWDMRHKMMPGIPTAYIEASYRGHKAGPGTYTATLTLGQQESTAQFTILPNPLYPTDIDYDGYDEYMSQMEANLTEMHDMTNDAYRKRLQLKKLIEQLDDPAYDTLKTKAKMLIKDMTAWDEEMVQRRSQAYDDVENFPNQFTANYMYLINFVESDIPRITEGARSRRAELDAKWDQLKATGADLLDQQIPALNKELWEAGVGAVWR